jgi:hypothetical protein
MELWMRFLVAALAAWRVAHLLAREDGPWDIVVRLRRCLGDGFWGQLLDCIYCLSLWTSLPAALFVTTALPDAVVTWLALSGSVCLLDRLGEPPLVMSHLGSTQYGGGNDGMLRTETREGEHAPDELAGRY